MAISKLILCASNQRLTAGVWFGTRLHYYETFANSEAGYQAFDAFIKKIPNMNAYLIADAIEEEYRLESLPHTTGSARAELLERKLNQFNRNNLFRTAHFINQDKDKRRDDNFLFVALSNADFLQGWMSVVQVNQVPLVGLYMLPMISQYTVQQMKLMAPNILLCERLSSGLRQTYLSNGRLRMSRLAPITDVKPNQMAYFYLVEIEKTRLYLLSQRFITDQTELQLVMPSSDPQSEVIGKSISQEQGMECKIVDSLAYAKNINIAPDLVAKHPELLHMQLLANGNIPDNLAPDQLTKAYHLNKIRQGIYVAAAAAALLGVGVAGYNFFQANSEVRETALLAEQTQQQLKRYEEVASNFPSTPIPSADLKTAIDIANQVKQYNTTPATMMGVLSKALEVMPEVAIQRLRWVQTNRVDAQDTDKTIEILGLVNGQGSASTAQTGELRQVAFVNAELVNFNGDYRGALTNVNRFAEELKRNPMVEQVVVLQEPVNVSSLANLKGSTLDENTSERTPAEFKLKIVLKHMPTSGGGLAMVLNQQDWKRLQIPLLVLGAALVVVGLLAFYAKNYHNEKQQALEAQRNLLNQARQKYLSSGQEREMIVQYLPQYQDLLASGFVGEERRIEWIETLRQTHLQHKLFSIDYNISQQAVAHPGYLPNLGGFTLHASTMHLDFGMLHEGDLLTLLNNLRAQFNTFVVRECTITRPARQTINPSMITDYLNASCELDWITLRDPQLRIPS